MTTVQVRKKKKSQSIALCYIKPHVNEITFWSRAIVLHEVKGVFTSRSYFAILEFKKLIRTVQHDLHIEMC